MSVRLGRNRIESLPLQIWWINHYALTPDQAGGTRHFGLSKHLVDLGHEVTIIASAFDHWSKRHRGASRKHSVIAEQVDGIHFVRLHSPGYADNSLGRFWDMMCFGNAVRQSNLLPGQKPPDIVVGSSPHLFAAYGAERMARKLGAHFFLEVRDIWPATIVEMGNISSGHPAVYGMQWIERYLYRKAERIVTLLPGSIPHFVANGAQAENVVTIPNGTDVANLPPPAPIPSRSPFTVMYAGSLGAANGLEFLVEAGSLLVRKHGPARFHIRIVGQGPEREALQNQVRRLGLTGMIAIEPAVAKTQVPALLSEADLLFSHLRALDVFRWGVSPNKIFDYQAAGRPILFAVNTEHNPVSYSGSGIVIPPERPDLIASAIEDIAAIPIAERQAMGRRAYDFVVAEHDYRALAKRLSDLFETVGAGRTHSERGTASGM